MQVLLLILIFFIGLVIGSFLNVVVYRLPRGKSIIWPGSTCPHCGRSIKPRDNIPILSFLLLGGRCRYCKNPISWRYPIVEASTAVLFLIIYLRFGWKLELALGIYFIIVLFTVALIDMEHQIIPNRIVIPAIGLGALIKFLLEPSAITQSLIGFLVGGSFLLIVSILRRDAMGGGDIKLSAFMGLILGLKVLLALFIAFVIGAIAGIFLILLKIKNRKELIPFGPFLAFGGLLTFLWWEEILNFYVSLY